MELQKAVDLVKSGEYVNLSGADFVEMEKVLKNSNDWDANAALDILKQYQEYLNPTLNNEHAYRKSVGSRYNYATKLADTTKVNHDEYYMVDSHLNFVVDLNVAMKMAVSNEEITVEALQKERKTESRKIAIEYYMALLAVTKKLDAREMSDAVVNGYEKISRLFDKKRSEKEINKALRIKPTQLDKKQASAAVVISNVKAHKLWLQKCIAMGRDMGRAGAKALDDCAKLESHNALASLGAGMALMSSPFTAPAYSTYRVLAAARILYKAEKDFLKKENVKPRKVFGVSISRFYDPEWRKAGVAAAASLARSVPLVTIGYGAYSLYVNRLGIAMSAVNARKEFNKMTNGDFSKETVRSFVKEGSTVAASVIGLGLAAFAGVGMVSGCATPAMAAENTNNGGIDAVSGANGGADAGNNVAETGNNGANGGAEAAGDNADNNKGADKAVEAPKNVIADDLKIGEEKSFTDKEFNTSKGILEDWVKEDNLNKVVNALQSAGFSEAEAYRYAHNAALAGSLTTDNNVLAGPSYEGAYDPSRETCAKINSGGNHTLWGGGALKEAGLSMADRNVLASSINFIDGTVNISQESVDAFRSFDEFLGKGGTLKVDVNVNANASGCNDLEANTHINEKGQSVLGANGGNRFSSYALDVAEEKVNTPAPNYQASSNFLGNNNINLGGEVSFALDGSDNDVAPVREIEAPVVEEAPPVIDEKPVEMSGYHDNGDGTITNADGKTMTYEEYNDLWKYLNGFEDKPADASSNNPNNVSSDEDLARMVISGRGSSR